MLNFNQIAFLMRSEAEHYKNNFDVVCTDNTSYDELTSKILFLVSK